MLCWPSGWYEALVEPITKDYRTCTMPVIDLIDDKTLGYKETSMTTLGGMNIYTLFYDWLNRRGISRVTTPQP